MKKKASARPLEYADHFGLADEDLRTILELALSRGGDFSEIYLEYKINSLINMEEDIIKETAESISLGLGIRVLSGEKTGYGYCNDVSFPMIKKAALTAASIASGRKSHKVAILTPVQLPPTAYSTLRPAHEQSLSDKIALVKRAYKTAQRHDPKIQKVKASLLDSVQYVRVLNSEGLSATDVRPLIRLTCFAIAERERQREDEDERRRFRSCDPRLFRGSESTGGCFFRMQDLVFGLSGLV